MNQDTQPSSLPRILGPITATAIVVGTVLGSGIFAKPHEVAKAVPYSGVVALLWILGGLLVLLGSLAYAEVACVLPRAGGNYVFLREGYGRLWGFLWGWVEFWIIRTGSLAALATMFSEALADLVGGPGGIGFWPRRGITLSVLIGLGWVNVRGVRWGGGLQVAVTIIKVGSLLFLLALPWFFFLRSDPSPVTTGNLQPLWPDAWSDLSLAGISTALLGIQWAYHGWMNIAPVAGEIDQPQRNIPRALLGGVAIIVTLYLGVNLAYYLTMPTADMQTTTQSTVAAVACTRLLGSFGLLFASLAIMGSTFGSLNGNLMVGPRLLYAMGQDGLAPGWLRTVHPRYQTPATAIITMTAWACLLVLGVSVLLSTGMLQAKKPFDMLTDYAMFGALIFETLAVVAIFVLRRTHPHVERPYRCPGYPYVPALYVLLPVFVLSNMFFAQTTEALVGVTFILVGVGVYYLIERPQPSARVTEVP